MEEIWKDIYFEENGVIWDYRGLYQVSNFGRIKSFNYNNNTIIRKLNFNKQGYVYIMLQKNKKRKCFAFIDLLLICLFLIQKIYQK